MLVLRVGCGGLDLLLSKLSTAQSNGKFRERNSTLHPKGKVTLTVICLLIAGLRLKVIQNNFTVTDKSDTQMKKEVSLDSTFFNGFEKGDGTTVVGRGPLILVFIESGANSESMLD